jgi:hypothetical protein
MPHGAIRQIFASFASQLLFSVDAVETIQAAKKQIPPVRRWRSSGQALRSE